jgi:hypothetical protein
LIPILFMSPNAFGSYMFEQSYSWPAKKSFAYIFEIFLGSQHFLGLRINLITTILFLSLIFFMFVSWIRNRFDCTFWFKIVVVIFTVYYGLFVPASVAYYSSDLGLANPVPIMIIFILIYFTILFFIFDKYLSPLKLNIRPNEEIYILSAFALFFLLFSSSQFNPWYFLWPLPFVLLINNKYIRILLLWLMFWNLEGIGIQLLPGLSLA